MEIVILIPNRYTNELFEILEIHLGMMKQISSVFENFIGEHNNPRHAW
jgi:hypothetical protein